MYKKMILFNTMERILYEAQRQVCLIRIHITWPREDTKFLFEWERVKYYLKPEKRNFVSLSGHVMFYLLYKHQLMPNHVKGATYYVAIATAIFSGVKKSSFLGKLAWYFMGVYKINIYIVGDWLPFKISETKTYNYYNFTDARFARW